MPCTPLIAFSSGAATVSSSVCAEAPGKTACTVTTGGAISGYCAIGSERIAAIPASTKNTEMTAAKIGRSMKNLESMAAAFRSGLGRRRRFRVVLRDRGVAALHPGGVCRRRSRRTRRGPKHDRAVRLQLGDPVDDHRVAGGEPGIDDPQVAAVDLDPFAEHHRANDGDVLAVLVLAGHVYEFPLRPVLDGDLRHRERI